MAIPTNLDIAAVSYNGTNIPLAGGNPTLQTKTKTYTPTTSQQTESVTADSGYDGLSAVNVTVNAMPSGTAGTPTATKGTVSNHSVSVTPSVTNSSGYIDGGTKTGTAVSVSASELDSGTKSITSNGNNQDVVGYAAVNVNVPNSYSASDEGKVVSNGALVAQSSDTITQNGTVDTTLINSLIVNVPTGGSQAILGYTQMKTGSITFPARYNSTGNRLIVSIADIGFTPTCFMLKATDKTAQEIRDEMSAGTETAGMELWAMYCRYPNGSSGNYYHHREHARINYNSGSPTMSGGQVWTAWTTQTNNYLYNNGTNIYYRTASNYGLPAKEYKWVALA